MVGTLNKTVSRTISDKLFFRLIAKMYDKNACFLPLYNFLSNHFVPKIFSKLCSKMPTETM
jgi:hypothetical protein